MRELGMWDSAEGIGQTFSDIEELLGECRFSNCTHTTEPGCAVKEALAKGQLSQERWDTYIKLQNENAYTMNQGEYLQSKKEKFKEIAKINNKAKRKGRR